MKDIQKIIKSNQQAAIAAIDLLESSLKKYVRFDKNRQYSHDELEVYDALSDRFMRAVEISIKYFRSWEIIKFGATSDNLRDLLNKAERNNLITSTSTWIDMRILRNKIVYDYLPEEIEKSYNLIVNKFSKELLFLKEKISKEE